MQFNIIKLCMDMITQEWSHKPMTINHNNEATEGLSQKQQHGELETYLMRAPDLQRAVTSFRTKPFHVKLAIVYHMLNALKAHY